MAVHSDNSHKLPTSAAQHPLMVARRSQHVQSLVNERAEREAKMRADKQAENDSMQMHEATSIMEQSLEPGTASHDVAAAVISQFKTAVKANGLSRTKIAQHEAAVLLPVGGKYTAGAVSKGLGVAGAALFEAGNLLAQKHKPSAS